MSILCSRIAGCHRTFPRARRATRSGPKASRISTGVARFGVVAVQPPDDRDQSEHGDADHDRRRRCSSSAWPAFRLPTTSTHPTYSSARPVRTPLRRDEQVRADVPQFSRPRAVIATDYRDGIEADREQVGSDREGRQLRVHWFSGPAPKPLARAPQSQRRAERSRSHYDSVLVLGATETSCFDDVSVNLRLYLHAYAPRAVREEFASITCAHRGGSFHQRRGGSQGESHRSRSCRSLAVRTAS